MNKAEEMFSKMNTLAGTGTPFLFVIDFDMKMPEIIALNEINPDDILYDFEGLTNAPSTPVCKEKFDLNVNPPSYHDYLQAFNEVHENLIFGNSYLANLTLPSRITISLSLKEIFQYSQARFKLFYRDSFVVFSPEPFVRIKDGRIFSFPMKGTIDASIPRAELLLLENFKENAEHATIVDLIRNDLSIVSEKVRVDRFKYIEKITTNSGELLQMSSQISGELPSDYNKHLGEIISKILPAGSVTGAPKQKTVEIIKSAEKYDRGFYTGVMGIFDGTELISSVMIRFIEKTQEGFIYKSGGGITIHSNPKEEYQELIQKVYVPFI